MPVQGRLEQNYLCIQLNRLFFYKHASKICATQSSVGKLGSVQQGQACSQLCTVTLKSVNLKKQMV